MKQNAQTISDDLVFISYAREDQPWAERLYLDLRLKQVNAWLDVRCLAAGANWKLEIKRAIRKSRYFILLLSKHSITKRGFVQREMKEAIEVLREFPTGDIFLIPAKLDSTVPAEEELTNLNWVDLLPDYHGGLARILSTMSLSRTSPLVLSGLGSAPSAPVTVIDRGEEVSVDMPLIIGPRAAISYAPFRSRIEFIRQFVDRLPPASAFADITLSYYFVLDTRVSGVVIGEDLKLKYPEFITIVIQNAYRDLVARDEDFSVVLYFGGVERTVSIPYSSIREISVPEIGLSILLKKLN